MKRFLHLFHRWAGIALCAFFAAWFFSGFFMMYVEYPSLTRAERLAAASELTFSRARLSVCGAARMLHSADFNIRGTPTKNIPLTVTQASVPARIDSVRLAQILGHPAYVFASGNAQPVVIFADTGEKLGRVTAEQARRAAAAHVRGAPARFLGTIQSDQWTVSSALNAHRPLHHFALDDAAGTELYVSSRTGEVVRDSTQRERGLNYLGAVIHWIYPHVLRQFPDAWAWVVDGLAAAGSVFAISGLWVGVLRARRRVPVPKTTQHRLIRWHYATGAIFGVVTLTWVFSGWMSMNPDKLNPPRAVSAAQVAVFAGMPFTPEDFKSLPVLPTGTVEAELLNYDGQPLYLGTTRDGAASLVPAQPAAEVRAPNAEAMIARAPALLPGASLIEARVLTDYDNYYYSRHPETGTAPLPSVRVRFDDGEALVSPRSRHRSNPQQDDRDESLVPSPLQWTPLFRLVVALVTPPAMGCCCHHILSRRSGAFAAWLSNRRAARPG